MRIMIFENQLEVKSNKIIVPTKDATTTMINLSSCGLGSDIYGIVGVGYGYYYGWIVGFLLSCEPACLYGNFIQDLHYVWLTFFDLQRGLLQAEVTFGSRSVGTDVWFCNYSKFMVW